MPYILPDRRKILDPKINELSHALGTMGCVDGDYNYVFARLFVKFLQFHGKRYTHINTFVGAMVCALLETYRRVAAPYEDQAAMKNGDVYEV